MLEYYNGNIGIGTIYPQHRLDVSGNINLTGSIYQGNALYTATQWSNASNNNIYYNGKVGVGTNVPLKELDVSGNINFSGNLYKDNQLYISSQWTDVSTNSIYYLGNIGIGTVSTNNKLTIGGSIQYISNGSVIVKNSYGNVLVSLIGNRYIGFTISWTNVVSDVKSAFTVSGKCHVSGTETEHGYRSFVCLVSPLDNNPSYPGMLSILESNNYNTSLFTNLSHDVVRVSATSCNVRVKWVGGLQPYISNLTLKVTASITLGNITLTPIEGSY